MSPAAPVMGADLLDPSMLSELYRFCGHYARSGLVPQHYRDRTEDLFVCCTWALALGIPLPAAIQNSYVVSGKLGFQSSLVMGLVNQRAPFETQPWYEVEGEGPKMQATAYAVLRGGQQVSATASMDLAQRQGWTKNKAYQTDPENMLIYRAAMRLFRRYCPEVIHGLMSSEELRDMHAAGQLAREVDVEEMRSLEALVAPAEEGGGDD